MYRGTMQANAVWLLNFRWRQTNIGWVLYRELDQCARSRKAYGHRMLWWDSIGILWHNKMIARIHVSGNNASQCSMAFKFQVMVGQCWVNVAAKAFLVYWPTEGMRAWNTGWVLGWNSHVTWGTGSNAPAATSGPEHQSCIKGISDNIIDAINTHYFEFYSLTPGIFLPWRRPYILGHVSNMSVTIRTYGYGRFCILRTHVPDFPAYNGCSVEW